ncbi:hypothetical protein HanRHA438_Chr11g0532281 [Helianthus annuus]|nr:hypothetical protein HanXRQr2_Chr04g0192711 [Helianthus annuus]KAJ0503688.1 hypothetical protein HanHA300_Chr11g0426851 [Helianthus annuus]KAJ0519670.1 hypothetical protein HanHA89_Chr11g0451191 [Helianthus annuus]KAJ0598989.1 hypothetical protein HanHA89_Chr04g0171771 [Helianthus annuus]KAJ0625289.1 hypothetical protein HanHA89_Chr01g0000001 [Helianthus annuus]
MAADQSKLRLALVRLLSCGFRSQRILERESEEKNWNMVVISMRLCQCRFHRKR